MPYHSGIGEHILCAKSDVFFLPQMRRRLCKQHKTGMDLLQENAGFLQACCSYGSLYSQDSSQYRLRSETKKRDTVCRLNAEEWKQEFYGIISLKRCKRWLNTLAFTIMLAFGACGIVM